MKIHKRKLPNGNAITFWYDRSCFSWAIATIDAEGNQIGSADYVGTKVDRDLCIKQRLKETTK